MADNKQILFSWLLNDNDWTIAAINYDIKRKEFYLFHTLIGVGKAIIPSIQLNIAQAMVYCRNLIENYNKLLTVTYQNSLTIRHVKPSLTENDIFDCCNKIQILKKELVVSVEKKTKFAVITQLLFYYHNLISLLKNEQAQSISLTKPQVSMMLKKLMNLTTLQEWLLNMVTFANEIGEQALLYQVQLAQLSNKHILLMYELFKTPNCINLINQLFLCKINPYYLYKKKLHPEKLISIQTRLQLLHSFIELFHKSILDILHQRGFAAQHDYLFHGEEMPPGIAVNLTPNFELLIIKAIRKWRLKQACTNRLLNQRLLDGLFRAYKYWFKPDLLLDTVMVLRSQLVANNGCDDLDALFLTAMQQCYSQLTTTECLDLYGYYANNDTCYLMRTFAAAINGLMIPNFDALSALERVNLQKIYNVLDCVMNALRIELQKRNINTLLYPREVCKQVINPGRRNLRALRRAIELYGERSLEKNTVLEQLFQTLGH